MLEHEHRALYLTLSAVLTAPSFLTAQEPGEPVPQDPEAAYETFLESTDDTETESDVEAEYYMDETIVADALQEVLSRPEFLRLQVEPEEPEEAELPGWLESFFDWLDAWLSSGGEEESEPSTSWLPSIGALNLVVYTVVAVALALIIVFILRTVLASRRSQKLSTTGPAERPVLRADRAPGEIAPGEYWQRALAFGQAADYRRAVREILLASMSTIERRGLIRFRKGLTNRDYFYAVRGAPRDSFAVIARAFELVYFGRREASSETFRECRQAYEQAFLRESIP